MEAPSNPLDRILKESYISPSQEMILDAIPGWDGVKLNESFTPSQAMHCSSADEIQSLRLHVLGDDESEDEFYDGEINFPKQELVEWGSPPETQGKIRDSYDSSFESGRSQSPVNREGSSPPFALLRDLLSSQYYTQSGMAANVSPKKMGTDGRIQGIFVESEAWEESREDSIVNFSVETETLRDETKVQQLSSGDAAVDDSKGQDSDVKGQHLAIRGMGLSQQECGGQEVMSGTQTLKRKTRVEPKTRPPLQRRTIEEDHREGTSDGEVERGPPARRKKIGVDRELEAHSPPQETALQDTGQQAAPQKSCEAESVLNSSVNKQPGGTSDTTEILSISMQDSPRVLTEEKRSTQMTQNGAVSIVWPFNETQSCRNAAHFSEGEGQSVRRDPRNFPESVMDVVMFHSGNLPPSSPNDLSLLSLVLKAGVDLPLPFDRNYI